MKFKHTFHVFVDNFSIAYKQLLYRLIIGVIALTIGICCLSPFVSDFINSEALNNLIESVRHFIFEFLNGRVGTLEETSVTIKEAYVQVIELLNTRISEIVLMGLLILVLLIIEKWFTGLGNYTTAVLINDKMALRANSPFMGTLISHLKEAALYNLIYVPLSFFYDLAVCVILCVVLFFMLTGIQFLLINVFLFTLMMILAISLKMTFTCDWLPALIRGKMSQKKAIAYSFSRKGKNTLNIFSNFLVLCIFILGVNTATIFTFGVGALLTVPSSYVIIICFEMVNYYDREEIRYFVDKDTIIKPEKERVLSREEFFKGKSDDTN